MKKIFILIIVLFNSYLLLAQNKNEQEIRTMLHKQTEHWNKGSLEKFMIGYWENDSLLFIGKTGPKYGYTTTLANYKKGYPDTARMGKLISTIISMQKLSPKYYFVVGKWQLTRSMGNVEGYYTLLLKRIKGKWVIIADHSS